MICVQIWIQTQEFVHDPVTLKREPLMKNSLGSVLRRSLFMILLPNQQLIDIGRLEYQETSGNEWVLYSVTRQSISIEIIFSWILSVPERRTPHRNFGSPKQTVVIGLFYIFANLFGATKIPMGVLRLGTLRIQEKIISIEMDCLVTLYISSTVLKWFKV